METITDDQLNLLIRLLLAHFICDFLLQTNKMISNKKWFSLAMLLHITFVFLVTWGLSLSWISSLIIATTHWFFDGLKITFLRKQLLNSKQAFLIDQAIHLIIIFTVWIYGIGEIQSIYSFYESLVFDYNSSLILLAFVWIIWPVAHIIKLTVQVFAPTMNQNMQHGGKLIGQFERCIILTLVLINQYEAIGFLITGKSIIRFAQKDEDHRSEYVLLGTMMSYAFAIITGVVVNLQLVE